MRTFSKFLLVLIGLMLVIMVARAQNSRAGLQYGAEKMVNEAQSKVGDFNSQQQSRKFAIVEYLDHNKDGIPDSTLVVSLITSVRYVTDGSITYDMFPKDSAILYFSEDGRPLKGTTTWKYADQLYDTTYTLKETIDDASTTSSRWGLTNIAKASNSPKPGVYNKSFTYVQVVSTASSQKITTTCDRFEFFSEHTQGHGWVIIKADGVQVAKIFQGLDVGVLPYTDHSKQTPSFYYNFTKETPTSSAKEHTIEFITEAVATGNQYILDYIKTFTYTLKPR